MKLNNVQLAEFFRDLATRVESGDSFEGNIYYTCMAEDLAAKEFLVKGMYRIGNTDGQGGMRIME